MVDKLYAHLLSMLRSKILLKIFSKISKNFSITFYHLCSSFKVVKLFEVFCGWSNIQFPKTFSVWNFVPTYLGLLYRQCAICYTDFWSAYDMIFPDCRHRLVGKETGLTAHIERLNNTLRQRISRLRLKNFIFF